MQEVPGSCRRRMSGPGRRCRAVVAWAALTTIFLGLAGCSRQFFRQAADREVAGILNEKNVFQEWRIENYYVYPHPLARFADWSNQDRPPMPPDDPGAWLLSPRPQQPKQIEYLEGEGYIELLAAWDAENRRQQLSDAITQENPVEILRQPCHIGPPAMRQRPWAGRKQPYLINLDQAMELASINSREMQNRREQLYLFALPVSLERFAFLPHFEAANSTIRDWAAKNSVVGKQNRWLSTSGVGISQQFSTGALLLLRLANHTTLNLTGVNKHTFSNSSLVLDLSQPLLRGSGRAVALEPLTQAERDFLYELRDFARFHREFYVSIAAGGAPQAGGGGVFSVQGQVAAIGYIPTLQERSRLQLERRNEESLKRILELYQAYAEAGVVSKLQVDQVEQQLLDAQVRRLSIESRYADSLDQFKVQLGLPTDLPLLLDFSPLEGLHHLFDSFDRVQGDYEKLVDQVTALEKQPAAPRDLRHTIRRLLTEAELVRGTQLQKQILDRLDRWQALNSTPVQIMELLADLALLPEPALAGQMMKPASRISRARLELMVLTLRRRQLQDEVNRLEKQDRPVPPELQAQLRETILDIDAGTLEIQLALFEKEPWRQEEITVRFGPISVAVPDRPRQRIMRTDLFRRVVNSLAIILEEVRIENYESLAKRWPPLPPVMLGGVNLLEGNEEEVQHLVGQTALLNRLDLMNQRGQLNDAWRRIAVRANSLLGTFDVRYNMAVLTPSAFAQPVNFEGERSRHQLELNTELPLVRKLERNNYRASLITYQRQRRALMQAEDSILFQVRQEIRRLRQLAESYETQKRSVGLAYLQVETALETFQQPPAPGEQRDAASAAAALTQQVLNAQGRLVSAQNSLVNIWVDFTTTRMRLYRDLELLQVDSRGVWINDFTAPDPAPEVPPERHP